MRRSTDDAFQDLCAHLIEWARNGSKPGIRIFVYPPEWEPLMLARFPIFVRDCSIACPLELVDLGQTFLAEVERRNGLVEQLTLQEREQPERPLHDLGVLANRALKRLLATPLPEGSTARLLVNAGALATFVSYSAITNELYESGPDGGVAAATVLAFPGEADERSLNLLRLRADTNYRVPRI